MGGGGAAKRLSPGVFAAFAGALLAIMAAAQTGSAVQESQTGDEAVHLVSGYSILRQGRFSLNAENPPVSKVLSALPLLWLDPDLPRDAGDWQDENTVAISRPFLYRNRLPAGRILFWGRLPTILLTLAFGAALAVWTRYRFGDGAALVALALFCFDPNFIAHARYVTSDVAGACFFFLGCAAWAEYLLRRRLAWAITASLATSIGIGTKFNLLLLPVVLVAMTLARHKARPLPWRAFALYLVLIPPALWAIYGFELRTVASDAPVGRFLNLSSQELRASTTLPRPAIALLDPAKPAGAAIHWAGANVPVPAYSFFKGIYRLYNHTYWGHAAYLLGRVSQNGWWWYFPLAFLVKSPAGLLALLLLAAIWGHRNFLLLPPAIYFAVAAFSHIDIGLRHILPVYPFLFVAIGIAVSGLRGPKLAAALVALAAVAAESAAIYPNYLAFFNVLSGGPRNGATYLVDSNLDWGQSALMLKKYMDAHGLQRIPLRYFGSADLEYYGIASDPLEDAIRTQYRGPAAISATALEMDPRFAFLRRCRPVDRVGYSIYVYELGSTTCAAP